MLNKKALSATAGAGNPWDVSYASWVGSVPYVVISAQSGSPNGVHFKSDGTKMYVIDGGTDTIYQYSLSTAWNISTASYDSKSFSVTSQEATPNDLFFKDDGTKFYVVGTTNDRVYQYSMSTAWDVSTASYDSKSFSVNAQEGAPVGLAFKTDGTKFYVIGGGNDTVFQYSMSTAWDVSTGSYDSKSFSVATQETVPNAVFFKTDGTKMYVVGQSNDTIYQYSLSTAWDVSTASYDSKSFSVTSQETTPQGLFFKDDGTDVFFVGPGNDTVWKASLSTAWDISTASFVYGADSFYVASQQSFPTEVQFKTDGTKMYVIGRTNDTVYQYSLSTAWSVDTASYDSKSFSVTSQEGFPNGLFFKPDGTKMYVIGQGQDTVFQYSLSTAWDVSTASYDSKSFSITTQDGAPQALFFKPDGTKLFILGSSNDRVYQYSLSTAWDVSTATFLGGNFSVATQETLPCGLFFKDDGTTMYIVGNTNDTVYQYSLSTAWDTSTASYASKSFSVARQATQPQSLFFKSDGKKMYIVDDISDTVIEYQVG